MRVLTLTFAMALSGCGGDEAEPPHIYDCSCIAGCDFHCIEASRRTCAYAEDYLLGAHEVAEKVLTEQLRCNPEEISCVCEIIDDCTFADFEDTTGWVARDECI